MLRCLRCLAFALLAAVAVTAQALNVAVRSDESASDFTTTLTNAGHTATTISAVQLEAGINAYDVLVMGHVTSWSAASCTSVQNFLLAGRRVVTEWNAVYPLFASNGANQYNIYPPQCAFFSGAVGEGNFVGTNTPINLTQPAAPVLAGLPNPLLLGGGGEYFYRVTGYDPLVWTVVATFNAFAATNPAIMYANYGPGTVAVGVFDYADVLPGNATAATLLNNLVTAPLGAVAPVVAVLVPTLDPVMLGALALALLVLTFALRRRIRLPR